MMSSCRKKFHTAECILQGVLILLYIIIYIDYWYLHLTPNAEHISEVKTTYTKKAWQNSQWRGKCIFTPRSHYGSRYGSRLNDERTILKVSFSISGERSPTNMWWCSEVSFFCVTAWAGPPHKYIHHYLSDSGWNFLINRSWKLLYWIPLIPFFYPVSCLT